MTLIHRIETLYGKAFDTLRSLAGDWFMGLFARLAFSSVLLVYFLNSVATKVGAGFPGFLVPEAGAYAQIVPAIADAAGYDVSKIAFIPWGLIVFAGTYAEFLLPLMILFGLFTRAASAGMIGFIAVMSFVDVAFHGVEAKTIGAMFDRVHDSAISDQRLLWVLPLVYLTLHGAGRISADAVLAKLRKSI